MIHIERQGVSAIQNIVYNELGWVFREQTVNDFGIDAEIEVTDEKYPTGKVIAVQIKSGASYFINTTEEGVIFRFDKRHKEYWLKHTLPVIVVLYHPGKQECIWESINKFTAKQVSDKWYKIIIPKENLFGIYTKINLLILAYRNNIENLAEEIDDLNVNTQAVFAMLNDDQKNTFLKARKEFDKKNVSSDRILFEYNREKLSGFVNTIRLQYTEDATIVFPQFIHLIQSIENFICNTQKNTLIILGEAGSGKSTLIQLFLKQRNSNDILYINALSDDENLSWSLQNIYKANSNLTAVIFDGWDMLNPTHRLNTWHELVDWQIHNQHVKLIITSRYMENCIWKDTDVLNILPLSQPDALFFLRSIVGERLKISESLKALVGIYNTPLMLKMLLMSSRQMGISLDEVTSNQLMIFLISHYGEEASYILESIAFRMMKENQMSITLSDDRYLKILSAYKELQINKTEISFTHNFFYELFAAKHIFRCISTRTTPQEFCSTIWDIFSNNLCSLEILNYLECLIKYEKNNDSFLVHLNYNFNYMLEKGIKAFIDTNFIFTKISNVFYAIWHIVSFANRIYYGNFQLTISNYGDINLSCFINIFNKIYFGHNNYLDFSHIDFSYRQLWRSNLIYMNFKKSILCHTNFLGSCFEGSNLEQANLSYCKLCAADLRHANLKDAILDGANVSGCMISENSIKYILPYKDTLRNIEKLIIFMDDGTIKKYSSLKLTEIDL